MTTFERFERDIPELMTELAPAQIPDYFDDMLQQTATHRQRPAWSYLERWLPMGVIAQALPARPFSWRPLLVLALVGLLIAAGLVAFIGAPPRLPPPFGPARNGPILMNTSGGDILSLDPATGRTAPVITGSAHEEGATLSPDGSWMFFARVSPDEGLFVARPDGSDIHKVLGPADRLTWIDWSQNSDRIVATGQDASGVPITLLIDPKDGATTTLRLGRTFTVVQGRYGTHQLVLTEAVYSKVKFWLVKADGTDLQSIPASPSAINEPALSPDGSKLAYATWDSGDGRGERIHVVDIDSHVDHIAIADPANFNVWQGAQFSPDGTKILTNRFTSQAYTYQLAIIPADGVGPVVMLGAEHTSSSGGVDTGAADVLFSPDGTKVYASYHDDSTTWLLDAATGKGQQVSWPASSSISWQRLAP